MRVTDGVTVQNYIITADNINNNTRELEVTFDRIPAPGEVLTITSARINVAYDDLGNPLTSTMVTPRTDSVIVLPNSILAVSDRVALEVTILDDAGQGGGGNGYLLPEEIAVDYNLNDTSTADAVDVKVDFASTKANLVVGDIIRLYYTYIEGVAVTTDYIPITVTQAMITAGSTIASIGADKLPAIANPVTNFNNFFSFTAVVTDTTGTTFKSVPTSDSATFAPNTTWQVTSSGGSVTILSDTNNDGILNDVIPRDVITDFQVAVTDIAVDVLDLRDLLQGEYYVALTGENNLSQYLDLDFKYVSTTIDPITGVQSAEIFATPGAGRTLSTIINVKATGAALDQEIVLLGKDLRTIYNTTTESEIITKLITDGSLLVDSVDSLIYVGLDPVIGNLVDYGADAGGYVKTINFNGLSINYDGAGITGTGASYGLLEGSKLTITLPETETMIVNMLTGEFLYKTHNLAGTNQITTFEGIVVDRDGDTASGSITFGYVPNENGTYTYPTNEGINADIGFDTLKTTGLNLDLRSVTDINHIERIDLTGNGDQTLILTAEDVSKLTVTSVLYITGDTGDKLQLNDLLGAAPVASPPLTTTTLYAEYKMQNNTTIYVDKDIEVGSIPII